MSDDESLLDAERLQDGAHVGGLGPFVVAIIGFGREAHAAQIRHDYRVIVHEVSAKLCPHVAGIAKAVDQDDGRPLTADAHVNLRAVGRDGFGFEGGRELFDLGARGRSEQHEENCEVSCAHGRLHLVCQWMTVRCSSTRNNSSSALIDAF